MTPYMVTFVKTRHFYESYLDFWRLVELSNFPIIYVDELDISKNGVYITSPMNEDWRDHINNQHRSGKPVNAHLINWNIERPSGSAGSVGEYAKQNRYLFYGLWPNGSEIKKDSSGNEVQSHGRFIDEVWHSDRRLSEETEMRFVTLGSDERLAEPGSYEKKYNFCHMSYITGRRESIYKHFENIGPNCWPPERDDVLRKSRFALNVHQDHHPFQEPLRFALFAAYGLPILSETIRESFPWSDEFMIFAGYDDLVERLNQLLGDNYSHYQQMAMKAKERMCHEFNFKKMVEQAIKESVGWR